MTDRQSEWERARRAPTEIIAERDEARAIARRLAKALSEHAVLDEPDVCALCDEFDALPWAKDDA